MTLLAHIGNVAPIEVIWTIIIGIGVGASALSLWDYIRDVHALRKKGLNGASRLVGRAFVASEGLRLFQQGLFLLLGIAAMTQPEPQAVGGTYALFARIILIVFGVMLVFNSVLTRYVRRKLDEQVARDLKQSREP